MTAPDIRLNEIPILEQNFVWKKTTGVYPFFASLVFSKNYSEQLKATDPENAVITIRVDAGFTPSQIIDTKIEGLYLIEPKESSPVTTTWVIADKRYLLKDQITTCYYNKTTIKNQQQSGSASVTGKPSEIRQDFDLFSVGRYVSWSVKTDGKPYTVKEILQIELAKTGLTVVNFDNDDESYVIENVEFIGIDTYRVITQLLEMSRLEMGINLDGSVYVYSIDRYNLSDLDWIKGKQKIRSNYENRIFLQDRSRIRPKKIDIKFEAKEEIWVTYKSSKNFERVGIDPIPIGSKNGVWNDEDVWSGKVISCENVLPIPYPTDFGGKKYTVGEWVPLHTYLDILGLTETEIRQSWYSNLMEAKLYNKLRIASGGDLHRDQDYARLWVGNLRQHYRQTFRIDPYYMDRIASWDTRRCAVVDNYSHYSPPSPLFADYSILGSLRMPRVAKRLTSWTDDMSIWEVNTRDNLRVKPTLGTVSMTNQALGIFRTAYPPPSFSSVLSIFPFALENPVGLDKGDFNNAVALSPKYLCKCTIKESFEMQTIISVVWFIDPYIDYLNQLGIFGELTDISEGRRFFTFSFDFSSLGGKRYAERLSRSEYARIGVKPRQSESESESVSISVSDSYSAGAEENVVNNGILEVIAKGEASRLMQQYNDFYEGNCSLYGLIDKRLMANMNEIEYSFSPGDGFNTSISFKPVTPFKLENKINQDAISFLHRHVSRGDSSGDLTALR